MIQKIATYLVIKSGEFAKKHFYEGFLEAERYGLAEMIDDAVLPELVLKARLSADFDLATHIKSTKKDIFPLKPTCTCDFCSINYYARLYRREYVNIQRSIQVVMHERARVDQQGGNPKVNPDKIWSNPKYINTQPVRNLTPPYLFATKQMRLADTYKRKARKYARLAKRLHRILSIPGNE